MTKVTGRAKIVNHLQAIYPRPCNIHEINKISGVCERTTRQHIKELIDRGKVKRFGKAYTWVFTDGKKKSPYCKRKDTRGNKAGAPWRIHSLPTPDADGLCLRHSSKDPEGFRKVGGSGKKSGSSYMEWCGAK